MRIAIRDNYMLLDPYEFWYANMINLLDILFGLPYAIKGP